MSRISQIYFVLNLASECYNNPDHFEEVWSNGISKLIDRWNPIFTDGYSKGEMVTNVIDWCSPRPENHNYRKYAFNPLWQQNRAVFWYKPPISEFSKESIYLITIHLFETLNYFFWHDSPCACVSRDSLKSVLEYEINVPVKDFDLSHYSIGKIRELLAEGIKERLCSWLGEDKIISPFDRLWLQKSGFLDGHGNIMAFFKIEDLAPFDLYMFIDKNSFIWRHRYFKIEAFNDINEKLWDKVVEVTSSVWGG